MDHLEYLRNLTLNQDAKQSTAMPDFQDRKKEGRKKKKEREEKEGIGDLSLAK